MGRVLACDLVILLADTWPKLTASRSREKERKVGWMGGGGEGVSEAGILLSRLKALHRDMRSYVMDD